MKKKNYIHHAPYLRNSIAYDHDFWCTCVEWWYLQVFFHFLKIFIFSALRRAKGQEIAQSKMKSNNYIHHTPYFRNSITYHDFWCTCVKWWYLQVFFWGFFVEIFIFWALVGRGQASRKNRSKETSIYTVSVTRRSQLTALVLVYYLVYYILCSKLIN